MHKLIRGIASASARHPWRTITSWLAAMGAVFFLAIAAGGAFVDDFSSPGSQSATALELLDESFPEAAKGSAMVVLAAHDGTTLEEHQDTIAQVLDDVSGVARVESVADPFASGTVSEDGRIGFAVITLDAPEREIGKPAFAVLSEAVSAMGTPGLQVELGGDAVFLNAAEETSFHTAIGLLVALVVLLVVFGTVVAAIVPIGLSLVAVGASIGGIVLMASTMNVSVSAIAVAGLVGLGVGVDYALFIVARYRENRSAGHERPRPVRRDGHLRHGGRLRGGHRHDRHGGPGHHGTGNPDLDRPFHRLDGAGRRRRGRDPAPRTPHPAR
jgi:RND superfamily putative drug exporter